MDGRHRHFDAGQNPAYASTRPPFFIRPGRIFLKDRSAVHRRSERRLARLSLARAGLFARALIVLVVALGLSPSIRALRASGHRFRRHLSLRFIASLLSADYVRRQLFVVAQLCPSAPRSMRANVAMSAADSVRATSSSIRLRCISSLHTTRYGCRSLNFFSSPLLLVMQLSRKIAVVKRSRHMSIDVIVPMTSIVTMYVAATMRREVTARRVDADATSSSTRSQRRSNSSTTAAEEATA
jgi:hypothetical protein